METSAKYERDFKYLTYYFDKLKFAVTEKLTNGTLVTSTPDLKQWYHTSIEGWYIMQDNYNFYINNSKDSWKIYQKKNIVEK